jgi:hypothetical protein
MFLLFSFHSFGQKDGAAILRKSYEELKKKNSLTYNIECTYCMAGRYDTLNFYGNAHLLRKAEDTVFGGMVWLALHDNTYSFYDGAKVYVVNKPHLTVHIYHPTSINNGFGAWTDHLVMREFFKPDEMKDRVSKNTLVEYKGDTLIDGRSCYIIATEVTDSHSIKFIDRICIDKAHYFPVCHTELYCTGADNHPDKFQYSAWHITAYDFAPISIAQFSADQLLKYEYSTYHHENE